ncbi:MAG TPA: hypothetical protein VGC32_09250 [Solirubrobacterales bacterium]
MLRRALSTLLATVAFAALLVPAAGADEPLGKGLEGSFTLKGTHGFEIKALIASYGEGGAGQIVLFVGKKNQQATYIAKGTVTKESVDFNLGPLGEIKAAVQPSGKKETLTSECGEGEKQAIEGEEYVGTIAFRGEEGFTEVAATRAPLLLASALTELVCPAITTEGHEGGDGVRGAGLAIKRKGAPSLKFAQNRPGARVFYTAQMKEKEGAVTVERSVGGYLGGSALTFAPSLKTAHFTGAAPFSGSATYAGKSLPSISRPGKGTWRGNLTVDFPGHADVPIAGPGFKASIYAVHRDKPHTVKR